MKTQRDTDNTPADELGWTLKRIAIVGMTSLLALFTCGYLAGYIHGWMERHRPSDAMDIVYMGGAAIAIGACVTVIMRTIRQAQVGGAISRRGKSNLLMWVGMLLVGLLVGFFVGPTVDGNLRNLDTMTISPTNAILLAIFAGIIMPATAWYWHRKVIDEQEEAAYKDGAYVAAYAFIGVLPVWWVLWRGGFLPPINGIAVYFVFSMIWLFVWIWKKYR